MRSIVLHLVLNPRAIGVFADYLDELSPSFGTAIFTPEDVNGGDCFHRSVLGQDRLTELVWFNSPFR